WSYRGGEKLGLLEKVLTISACKLPGLIQRSPERRPRLVGIEGRLDARDPEHCSRANRRLRCLSLVPCGNQKIVCHQCDFALRPSQRLCASAGEGQPLVFLNDRDRRVSLKAEAPKLVGAVGTRERIAHVSGANRNTFRRDIDSHDVALPLPELHRM